MLARFVIVGAMQHHHGVGVLLDGARFAQVAQRGRWSWRSSELRLTWASAITGIFSSRARNFRRREIRATCSWRLSRRLSGSMSCK